MDQGKELYAQKRYADAAKHFIQVINACPCGIAFRERPCLCKHIVASIEAKALKDELRKSCICSAKSGRRCERKNHVDAFDSLAAAREKEGSLEHSIDCTEQMINLSPRDPKGYLRLGKILRLQGKPAVAHDAYVLGAELVAAKHPDHALLPILKTQAAKVKGMTRTDPLAKLPYELIRMILRDIGFRSLCLCLRVSKTWRAVLISAMAQDLWRPQHYFYGNHKPQGFAGPRTVFRYASFGGGQITDLTIDGCKQFGLKYAHLTLILSRCGRSLRHLKLRGSMIGDAPPGKVSSFKLPHLESLYLGLGLRLPHQWLLQLLRDTSRTMRELSVFDVVPDERENLFPIAGLAGYQPKLELSWPQLPCLESLNLSSTNNTQVHLGHLCSITPNLQSLWLDDARFIYMPGEHICWPKLRSVFVGGNVHRYLGLRDTPIELSPGVQELHIEETGFCFMAPLTPEHWPELPALQKVSVRSFSACITAPELELLLCPGLVSGTTEELGIHPFPLARYLEKGKSPSMEWLKSENVTFLSVSGLLAEPGNSININDGLLDLVSRFPNLKVLDIDKEGVQDATLGKIFGRGVHTIYYAGDLRENLREWAAATHKAKLIYGPCRSTPAELPDRPAVSRRLMQSTRRARERAV